MISFTSSNEGKKMIFESFLVSETLILKMKAGLLRNMESSKGGVKSLPSCGVVGVIGVGRVWLVLVGCGWCGVVGVAWLVECGWCGWCGWCG